MDKELKEHRLHFVEARQKAFDDYDKTVLALSAGALAISMTFLKDLIGPGPTFVKCLFIAWICWGLSVVSILVSYYASQLALDKAIAQIDAGERSPKPGGSFATVTRVLNASGGILFGSGLVLFIIFVSQNLEVINVKSK